MTAKAPPFCFLLARNPDRVHHCVTFLYLKRDEHVVSLEHRAVAVLQGQRGKGVHLVIIIIPGHAGGREWGGGSRWGDKESGREECSLVDCLEPFGD